MFVLAPHKIMSTVWHFDSGDKEQNLMRFGSSCIINLCMIKLLNGTNFSIDLRNVNRRVPNSDSFKYDARLGIIIMKCININYL